MSNYIAELLKGASRLPSRPPARIPMPTKLEMPVPRQAAAPRIERLMGASVTRSLESHGNALRMLTNARDTIAAEIERLGGELQRTDAVIRAHQAAFAILQAEPDTETRAEPEPPAEPDFDDVAEEIAAELRELERNRTAA